MRLVVLTFLSWLLILHSNAQTFSNQASSLGIIHTFNGDEYGGGVSFADFDKDGWDDLSFTQSGGAPQFYRNTGGTFVPYTLPVSNTGNMKNLIWVDFDNDNDRDLFVCGIFMPLKLYQNNGAMGLTDITASSGLPISSLYLHYAGSWADYDLDGFLDLYISNYNGPGFANPNLTNILMRNNGDGTFSDVTLAAGVSNGTCYTLQSLWVDYNMDLLPDLMVVNDRTTCDNYLYENNGDGTFSDVSIASGIGNHFIFSMNANGDDYDNDGDLDTYVTNNPFGNLLYRNNGSGGYDEVAEEAGVTLGDHSWAAQFFDYDNDTHQDLHVSVSPFWGQPGQNRFYKNMGDGTFDEFQNSVGLFGDVGWHHSSAIGDYNNDGHFDVACVLDAPTTSRIWKGGLSNNNWIKVTPQGTIGNKDGVGSWIHCYAGGNHYVRYTYCGEGYLGQNSYSEIFGLGSYTAVDSLVVNWPSGITDHYYDLAVNQQVTLIEGSTIIFPLSHEGNTHLCPGEQVVISVGNFSGYLWSNGLTTPSIVVDQEGEFYCTVTTNDGYVFSTDTLAVTLHPVPEVDAYIQNVTCFGSEDALIILDCETGIDSVAWNGGLYSEAVIGNLPVGTYNYELTDLNGCQSVGVCTVDQPTALTSEVTVMDNLCFGATNGSASVVAEGGTPPYQVFWSTGNGSNLAAGQYGYTVMDANGCDSEGTFDIAEPEQLVLTISTTDESYAFGLGSAEAEVTGGMPPYDIQWSSGASGVTAPDLFEDQYWCAVTDANGCVLQVDFVISYNHISPAQTSSIQLYPNPFSDELNLAGCSDASCLVYLTDLSGRVIISAMIAPGELTRLPTQDLSQGIYMVNLITGSQKITMRAEKL